VVEGLIVRAALKTGERVVDMGTGTSSGAFQAAPLVGCDGMVTGIDISSDLRLAQRRATELSLKPFGQRPAI